MVEPISERLQMLTSNDTAENDSSRHPVDDFADILADNLSEVNELEREAEQLTEQFAMGEIDDIHKVTVATEKARLALQLATEIQNRVIQAHDEIMQMQI